MSKRFTDTNKYKKPFIRGLQGAYKILWDYLYHECDHAGIWIVDFEVAQMYVGKDMKVNREDALKYFNAGETRVIEFDKGSRWFIPSFIEFQYGELRETNRVHNSVLLSLKKHNLILYLSPLQGATEGAKDKDKEKEKDKDLERGSRGETFIDIPFELSQETVTPSSSETFLRQNAIFSKVNLDFMNAEDWFNLKSAQIGADPTVMKMAAKSFLVDLRDRDLLDGKELTLLRSHFISWYKKKHPKTSGSSYPVIKYKDENILPIKKSADESLLSNHTFVIYAKDCLGLTDDALSEKVGQFKSFCDENKVNLNNGSSVPSLFIDWYNENQVKTIKQIKNEAI